MKQFYILFWIAVLVAFCAFLIWWKAWLGVIYTIVWASILYELKTARNAPPHELKHS